MKSQYGLRENSNTENLISEFMDYAYDSTHNSECWFADYTVYLSKAFDSVNHTWRMLRRLQHIGIRGIFSLFKDIPNQYMRLVACFRHQISTF